MSDNQIAACSHANGRGEQERVVVPQAKQNPAIRPSAEVMTSWLQYSVVVRTLGPGQHIPCSSVRCGSGALSGQVGFLSGNLFVIVYLSLLFCVFLFVPQMILNPSSTSTRLRTFLLQRSTGILTRSTPARATRVCVQQRGCLSCQRSPPRLSDAFVFICTC